MKHVRLTVDPAGPQETHPLYDEITETSFVDNATALQWNLSGDDLGVLHYVHGDAEAFVEEVEDIPDVVGWEHAEASDNAFFVYVLYNGADAPAELPDPFTDDGFVVIPPTRYHDDGTVSFSIFGSSEAVDAGLDRTPDPVDVDSGTVTGVEAIPPGVRENFDDREEDAIEAAIDGGYYAVPRTGSIEDVADQLDGSASTAGDLLGSVESKLIMFMFN